MTCSWACEQPPEQRNQVPDPLFVPLAKERKKEAAKADNKFRLPKPGSKAMLFTCM